MFYVKRQIGLQVFKKSMDNGIKLIHFKESSLKEVSECENEYVDAALHFISVCISFAFKIRAHSQLSSLNRSATNVKSKQ